MFASLSEIWLEITSLLMSIILSFGTTVGIFVPSTTTSATDYYDSDIKNVIYLIGDGMGPYHLEKTKSDCGVSLTMDTFDIKGSSHTRSYSDSITDSAAGGTALATGERTYNGAIGVYFFDGFAQFSYPKNITELLSESGKMTGVITTDETSGATPASFSAHSSDRDNTEDITKDQLASDIDIIWGKANGLAPRKQAEENGYTYITNYSDMMALPEGSRSFAQFGNELWPLSPVDDRTPNLEQMAEKAIDILDDTDEGFFLMIEGAHIDKHSHSNLDAEMTEALREFDKTVKYVLDYAKKDGETLVVITADHETGGITMGDDGKYHFTTGSHTDTDVPVLVYGSDKILRKGEVLNNYEIPIRIAYCLGFQEDQFPYEVEVAA